jgi:hypothetical protein
MLGKAPKGKGTAADIEAMVQMLPWLEAALTEAQGMIDSEDYCSRNWQGKRRKDKAAEVAEQINQAIAKKK